MGAETGFSDGQQPHRGILPRYDDLPVRGGAGIDGNAAS